ncbi:MAG: hypothetical protein FWD58_06930, partial [Firmicutes bacterium]|nr:hypothetical protein [Bacillota bacterium]
DNGWLTQEDLRSIAYYHHDGKKIVFDDSNFCYEWLDEEESYIPIPKIPECLDTETEKQIKQTRVNELRERSNVKKAKVDGISIVHYYGTYSGSVALKTRDKYTLFSQGVTVIVIASIVFSFTEPIRIWKDKD